MENPKKRLPTLGRVDFADRVYDFLPEGLYSSEGVGLLRLGVIVNREVDTFPFVGRIGPTNEKQLIGQVVERSSESMKDFAYQSNNPRGDFCQMAHVIDRVSRLRIELGTDSVSASFGPCAHLSLKITALFLGPFNAL
jgi:hypothetical protein